MDQHIKCAPMSAILGVTSCQKNYANKLQRPCKDCTVGKTQDYSEVTIDMVQHMIDNPPARSIKKLWVPLYPASHGGYHAQYYRE